MIGDFLVTPLTIQRFTPTGDPSPRGHRAETWSDLATAQGFVVERQGVEVNGPELGGSVISDALIGFSIDVDVTEKDRVVDGSATYELLFCRRIRDLDGIDDHFEIDARRVR